MSQEIIFKDRPFESIVFVQSHAPGTRMALTPQLRPGVTVWLYPEGGSGDVSASVLSVEGSQIHVKFEHGHYDERGTRLIEAGAERTIEDRKVHRVT